MRASRSWAVSRPPACSRPSSVTSSAAPAGSGRRLMRRPSSSRFASNTSARDIPIILRRGCGTMAWSIPSKRGACWGCRSRRCATRRNSRRILACSGCKTRAEGAVIESLLVANRGEIACRIFRTARRLGLRTIAVFSDADAGARHVREADEAVRIGPAVARDSYLSIERLIEAARIFVGPPAAAIAAMGSKIVAKTRAHAAGVPVLPGYAGSEQDLEHLMREALRAGLPLMIKPAAGGGGKGMQIVREASELSPALAAARRLAESAFGDGALLLERYLPAPRHIEVQVFADTHGNFVHLGERDCSIQRRHQDR